MTTLQISRRSMWRPDSDIGTTVFEKVLPVQFDSWLWRGEIADTKSGRIPGPGRHPDAGKKFGELTAGVLKVVRGNCEGVLMMLEHLRPEELEEMRRLGSSIVEGKDFGENMRPDLMEKVARVHHDFWILNRSLNGMRHMWKAPGYVDHWGHELWDKGLSQQAKDADFIQARAHCRTLALLDDDTFGQIVAWAAEKEAA